MQNSIVNTTIRYTGPKFLTDIQYKSLGYITGGSETTSHTEWVDDNDSIIGAKPVTKWVKYATYCRHVEYPTNFLLGLVAVLMKFIRMIRGIVKWLIPLAIIILILFSDSSEEISGLGLLVFVAYFATWGATLLMMGCAKAIRTSYRMDERLDEICANNGWKRWSEYRGI